MASTSHPERDESPQHEQHLISQALRDATPPNGGEPRGAPMSMPGYTVHRELHRGGQAVVYEATQHSTGRRVAIKVVKSGPFLAEGDRFRFQQEIEILGGLRHPNIVTIIDSGIANDCPYLVMELIEGPALDDHFNDLLGEPTPSSRTTLSRQHVRQALALFSKICNAVQAAHLKGVIHRDIKPNNVRIDAAGEPQVLDFGLARLKRPDEDSANPLMTETGQFVGTPPYASPEQATGDRAGIDVRTDVYSLGVMFYRLLTREFPYDVQGPLHEVVERIAHTEPAHPTTHVTRLPGDVETILLKCLSKDRDRRYQNAGELSADITRFLDGEPIAARRDSGLYLLRMFAHRHRVAALVTLAFVALLGASSVSLAYMYNEQVASAEQAEQLVEFQAQRLAEIDAALMGVRIKDALVTAVRESADPAKADTEVAHLEQALRRVNFTDLALSTLNNNIFDQSRAAIDARFVEQPQVRARLLHSLAKTLTNLGLFDPAMNAQQQALDIRSDILGDEHPDTLSSLHNIGFLHRELGNHEAAFETFDTVLDARRRVLGPDHPDTLKSTKAMGYVLHWYQSDRREEALAYYAEAHAGFERVLGEDDRETLDALDALCSVHMSMKQYEEAWPYCEEALADKRRVLGNEDVRTAVSVSNMGVLLGYLKRFDEALPYYDETIDVTRRARGDLHPNTLLSVNNKGSLLLKLKRYEEARPYYDEALAGRRRILGDEHPDTLYSLANIGILLARSERHADALPYFHQALEGRRRVLGNDDEVTLSTINNIGTSLYALERYQEAEVYFREGFEGRTRVLGPGHDATLTSTSNMGAVMRQLERHEEAMDFYQEAYATSTEKRGEDDRSTIIFLSNIGGLLTAMERNEEALDVGEDALERKRRVLGDDDASTLISMVQVGRTLLKLERVDDAEPYLVEALDTRRRVLGNAHSDTLASMAAVAEIDLARRQWAEAETLLLEAIAGMDRFPAKKGLLTQILHDLITLYEGWHADEPDAGYDVEAAKWQARIDEGSAPPSSQ